MISRIAVLFFCLISTAIAEPGYDVLGVAKYCKVFLNAPKLPAVSTLLNTFGDPLPCIEKRIKLGGLKTVQVDLIDATCWRNKNCPAGAPRPDNLKVIRQRSLQVNALAVKYPQTDFWISPALEHDVKNPDTVRSMLETAQKACPTCRVINSPFTGAKPKPYEVEVHGTTVSGFSVSADGKSCFDADTLDRDGNDFNFRTSGECTTFAWVPECNGRVSGEDIVPPPMQRTCWPTADLFKQMYLVMQPQEVVPPPPAQCKTVVKVAAPEIYKPNAEAYGPCPHSDKRGNRPLLIIKKKGGRGEKLRVISSTGKDVGCFAYYSSYQGTNLHRWYMGDCSAQTPAGLYADLGGEWGFVKLSPNKCLLINSIRRLGSYR